MEGGGVVIRVFQWKGVGLSLKYSSGRENYVFKSIQSKIIVFKFNLKKISILFMLP